MEMEKLLRPEDGVKLDQRFQNGLSWLRAPAVLGK